MSRLRSVDDVLQQILDQTTELPAEHVPIAHALGRVLAFDIVAGESLPPFTSSSMDGYAVRAADVTHASPTNPVCLTVTETILAGMVPAQHVGAGQAARIMTGAPMPDGADAVVPVESTDDTWQSTGEIDDRNTVNIRRAVRLWDYVRPVGEDIRKGDMVLHAYTELRPQDVGMLASLGHAQVRVVRQPRVAIVATGDELVDVNEPLAPGKIRNSNSYVLSALVTAVGGIPLVLPIAHDTLTDVRSLLQKAVAQQPDVIISSAGVSVGTHDVVRAVVNEMGQVEVWRVNLRPGKPLAFGHIQRVPFFGLPGNPVSTMVTFDIFVRPMLLRQMGLDPHTVLMREAVLGETLRSDGRRSYVRVRLERQGADLVAYSTGTQSSGALMSMVLADGLLIIPEGVTEAPKGNRYHVRLLRDVTRLP